MKNYKCVIRFITKHDDGRFEETLDMVYKVKGGRKVAIQTAIAWAKNRLEALKEMGFEEIFSVEVGDFLIGTPDETGFIKGTGMGLFFKHRKDHDYPFTLEQKAEKYNPRPKRPVWAKRRK